MFYSWTFSPAQFQKNFPPPPPSGEKRRVTAMDCPTLFFPKFCSSRGADLALSSEESQMILEEFERSWQKEIVELLPFHGADSHYFNVYLGDSGETVLLLMEWQDTTARQWRRPLVVISLASSSSNSFGVIPHEFSCRSTRLWYIPLRRKSAWYWESTAIWIGNEVYPDITVYALFFWLCLCRTSHSIFLIIWFWNLQEYYQYGAFIFPKYLSSFGLSGYSNSWVETQIRNPLTWWEDYFGRDTLHDHVFDFYMRNRTWDYPHHDQYVLSWFLCTKLSPR